MAPICQLNNCHMKAYYARTYGNPIRCKTHKENMRLQYEVCFCGKVRPTFNYPGESRAKYCTACKEDGMGDIKNCKCLCGKSIPHFNYPGESSAICCASCKEEGMINIKSQKCLCGKSQPNFNYPNETKGKCCTSCKEEGMIDIINPKCLCGKVQPSFNYPGESRAICCASCKKEGMTDVKSTKCFCGKVQPLFNYPEESKATHCASCKTPGMTNVNSKKCFCGKSSGPTFNYPGEKKATHCASCKEEGMVDVITPKCLCGKSRPSFNYPNKSKATYCSLCKLEGMINVKDPQCKGQDGLCQTSVNKKYRGYCAFCFSHMFPDDPLTKQIRVKTKEIAVRDFINEHFEGFMHDKPLETNHCDCSVRRRPDHRKLINNTLLVIETDENQHKSYSEMDEETRYNDLFMAFAGRWIYIRFNPDKYNGKNGKIKDPPLKSRLTVLKNEIDKQIERINNDINLKNDEELVERVYLYYDGYN